MSIIHLFLNFDYIFFEKNMEKYIENIKNSKDDVKLTARVIANAKKNNIEFLSDFEIKLHIQKIAKDNEANKEIVKFLSKIFDKSKSKIQIISGEKSNKKVILIINKN